MNISPSNIFPDMLLAARFYQFSQTAASITGLRTLCLRQLSLRWLLLPTTTIRAGDCHAVAFKLLAAGCRR